MKQVATKITEYVRKSKRAKLYGVFGLIYLIAVIFVMNDAWLYQTPIAKLTKVETSIAGENKSTRGTQEIKYKQKIRGVILNGTNKGKIVDFSNEYTYTGMLKQKYHKGDKVLLNGSESNVGSSIQSVKRDTELVVLLGLLIFALMTIAALSLFSGKNHGKIFFSYLSQKAFTALSSFINPIKQKICFLNLSSFIMRSAKSNAKAI